jgi:tetratricopeptide (TPR) repeat protein
LLLVHGLIARGQLERAESELAVLLAKAPTDANVRSASGTLRLAKKDAAGARHEYERALQRDPKNIEALTGLAKLDAKAGQLDRARKRIASQLAGDQRNTELLVLAARIDLESGDMASGEQKLRTALNIDASNLSAYELLGRMYIQQQKLDQARREFEQFVARHPKSVGGHTIVGVLLHAQNRIADAERAYQRALEIDPGAPVAANNLAYIYADRGENLDHALALAKIAAGRFPDEPTVRDTIGWVYYKKQLPGLAVPEFEKSAQRNPRNPLYQFHLGLAYLDLGDKVKAKAALQEALRISDSFAGAAEARRMLASLQG